MNHSQTIVCCIMTCALAREHGASTAPTHPMAGPVDMTTVHPESVPVQFSSRLVRCTEFRVLCVVRRILRTTLQVISLS